MVNSRKQSAKMSTPPLPPSDSRRPPPFPNDFTRLSQDSPGDTGGGSSGFQDSGAAETISMLMTHTRSSQEGRAFLYDELALSAGTGGLGSSALDALMDMLNGTLNTQLNRDFGPVFALAPWCWP